MGNFFYDKVENGRFRFAQSCKTRCKDFAEDILVRRELGVLIVDILLGDIGHCIKFLFELPNKGE
jgi:hypothetical protein